MNWRAFLRYFYRGPGVILLIVLAIIGICFYIGKSNEAKRAEDAKKRQVNRAIGRVDARQDVDTGVAPQENVLLNRTLNPINRSAEASTQPQILAQAQVAQVRPALAAFYEDVPVSVPSPTPQPAERPKPPEIWLPRGIYIPCVLVGTVESSHLDTPVVGEVTQDVWQICDGIRRLVIPAGTLVNCFAKPGAVRDRIEVSGRWSLTFPDGKEFELQGVACVRQADATNQSFGPEDGSAGLQGELVESDHWSNAKALIALLITATMQTGTAVATSALQASHTTGVVGLPDTTPILSRYLEQLLNGETGDGRFVRVQSSTEFYIYPVTVVEPTKRSIGARRQEAEDEAKQKPFNNNAQPQPQPPLPIDPGYQPQQEEKPNDKDRIHF